MFKWLRERRKQQLIELQEEIEAEKNKNNPEQAEEEFLAEAASALDSESGKNSKDPWVTIVGDAIGEEGLQLSLDWNDAFIKFLRANGVEGSDETQIVQKWLAMIAKQQADRLSEEHLELEGKTSEFE